MGIGLSNHGIVVYDIETLKGIGNYGHDGGITGLRFSPKSDHLLYSSSLDGSIKLWDIRSSTTDGCASEFTGKWTSDDGSCVRHPLTAFDVCNRDRIVVAGTESDGVDSFLLFWDVRAPLKPLGGYWESQAEDVTQVTFHPVESDIVAAGSMDGLVNIFDIRQSCEDDALSNSLNTMSTVDKISWLGSHKSGDSDEGGGNRLSCITHAETLQIWQADEASKECDFSRVDVAEAMKVKSSEDCYLVDVFLGGESQEETLILGGSFKSGCLRLLHLRNGRLSPWAILNASSQVVRCCWGDQKRGLLATGGEDGLLTIWKRSEGQDEDEGHKETHKMRVKKRNKLNVNPY
ncbi:WD repeat-containing protein 89 isoform X2 [Ischnura elegans]|uniref:WD repeat-containing protein 89 isoform X2 n=1 Tax=Ischnura elegans TaxID=197161 RepID=UPI001ED89697|nr:WD repeat-containing protein 89 isoform X2 [Ischnura elegans]